MTAETGVEPVPTTVATTTNRTSGQQKVRTARVVGSVVCIAIGVLYAAPIVWMLSLSLRSDSDAGRLEILPNSFTVANYPGVFNSLRMGQLLINSTIIAGGTALLTVAVSALAAYGFVRYRNRLTEVAFVLIVLGMMLPQAALVIPMFVIMRQFQLYDTLLAVIIGETALAIPLAVLILRGYVERIPQDLTDAARVDGAKPIHAFRLVVLPILMPGIISAALFTTVFTWNSLLLPLVFLGDPAGSTLTASLSQLLSVFSQQGVGSLAAASIIAILPLIILLIFTRRYYVQGIAAGALKG